MRIPSGRKSAPIFVVLLILGVFGLNGCGVGPTADNQGGADQLAFSVEPANTTVNTPMLAINVVVEDANKVQVTGDNGQVALVILVDGAVGGGSVLGGTTVVNAVNGVATFNNITINNVGNGFVLGAQRVGLASATSTAFNITP